MATRSKINVKVGDVYHSIYCHNDGYPEGVGFTLVQHYNSQKLAEKLVSFGSASCIYESCDKPRGHTFDTPVSGYTVYYGRDRGETDTEFEITDEPVNNEDYCYIWNGSEWLIFGVEYDNDDNEREYINTPLTTVLGIDINEVESIIESGKDKGSACIEGTKVEEIQKHLESSLTVFTYFGCTIDEVIAINEEWLVQYNTDDPRMTDSYNERVRWSVRHREAPYQGMDEDGIWHHTFFGRTLYEAVTKANEYLKRGKEFETNYKD